MSEKEKMEKRREESKKSFMEMLEQDLEADAENAKNFPLLTKQILLGANKTEDITFTAKDGKKYRATIHALGEGEILDALEEAGLEWIGLGDPKHYAANMKFHRALFRKAIVGESFTAEEIGGTLRFKESERLAVRILNLSGFFEPSAKSMDFFREERPAVV